MIFGDYYEDQWSSDTGSTTSTTDSSLDPFGLKEQEKEEFEEITGTSWENATQEDIEEARSQQFNPILEETGAVNEDGSYNDDVHDDVTTQPGEDSGGSDSSGGSTVIGSIGDGLGNMVGSVGDAGSGLADWADETADQAVSDDVNSEEQGFLQGLIDKAYKSSEEKSFWERQGLFDKLVIAGSAVALTIGLGPKVLEEVSN